MPVTQRRYAVFLSHNSRDKVLVEVFARKLKEAGLTPWFDKWEGIPGDRWLDELGEGMFASDTCAVFIGPHGQGDWEAEEINLAQTRAAKDPTFRIILVLLPGVPDPFDSNTCPPFLRTRNWIDFRKGPDDQGAFHRLQCGIKGIPPGSEGDSVSTGDKGAQDKCPYRGLQVFDVEDAEFYFGRTGEIQRLEEKLKATRFIGVLGASGSGKSSLVRAGLISTLTSGDLPGSQTWKVVRPFRPGSAPLDSLVLSLAKLPGAETNGLLELLRGSECALNTAVRIFLESPSQIRAGTKRVLLVVDQLEEIFTLCDKESDRSQFLANLFYAGSVPSGGCIVVVALRADFYHKLMAYPEFAAAFAAQQFLVSPMQNDSLVQAIEQPARIVNLTFEPGLIETIVNDVAKQPGSLPLLEHALLELWKRRQNGQLTFEGYVDSGAVKGAIAKRAEAIYEAFGPEEQAVMQRIMQRLTELGEGTEDTRRRARVNELWTDTAERHSVEEVVERLVDSRLLTISSDLAHERTVDVAHEALIRGWPRLHRWIEENAGALRIQHRLAENASEWRSGNRNAGFLYRGLRLAEAQDLKSNHASLLNDVEKEFIDASYKAERLDQRAARKRRRVEIVTFIFGLVVIGSVVANVERVNQALVAGNSRRLVARAMQRLDDDPLSAVRLALQADSSYHTEVSESALRLALSRFQEAKVLRGHEDAVYSVAFSPDGNQILTASLDQTARIWDAHDERDAVVLRGHRGAVNGAAFSPDGKRVVTAGDDGTARIWDGRDGHELLKLEGHTDHVNSAAFNSDGTKIVTASSDQTARIWNVQTRKNSCVLRGLDAAVISAVFNPNGKLVVTASTNSQVAIWDVDSCKQIKQLIGHSDWINTAVFSPDGSKLVTASKDGTARIWDVNSRKTLWELKGHVSWVKGATFSRDGRSVVTASADGTARTWDVSTGRQLSEFSGHSGWVYDAAFSKDGWQIVTAGRDHTIRIWNLQVDQQSLELNDPADSIGSAAFNRDVSQLATADSDLTARIWEVSTGKKLADLRGHRDLINDVAFSPGGTQMVTASSDQTAQVWDTQKRGTPSVLTGHGDTLYRATFSPDGRRIVTASRDWTAQIWDAQTYESLLLLPRLGHTDTVLDAVFSPDGTKVITASYDQTARVWDALTGKPLLILQGLRNGVMRVAFSPDGTKVVMASIAGNARLVDIQTEALLAELTGHTDSIVSVAFSPDGKQVVTASVDGTARIWDVYTGKLIWKLFAHGNAVLSAAFTPDGKHVITVAKDKIVRTYTCEACEPIDDVKKLAIDRLARLAPESHE